MNVLIVNPIMYTSETKTIKRAESVKDSMIYDLCLAFADCGHKVTLFAAEPYKTTRQEEYPFEIIWGKCAFQWVCLPHCFPYMPELPHYIREHKELDLIITGEVFSLNSLNAVFAANKKVIIWHELAKHNAMFKKVPSKIWYNIVARVFMRNTCVVARSEEARRFISKYCRMTKKYSIDHGVNLDKFQPSEEKDDYFVVCSQLIARKRIDGILYKYRDYLDRTGSSSKLYIVGDGPLREEMEKLTEQLGITEMVIFTGKMTHEQLLPYLARAKALLINTEKDNSMISIVEAIAVGTPIITTDVPLNSTYIKAHGLGIVGNWTYQDLELISNDLKRYVTNCLNYRDSLSTKSNVARFIDAL